MSRRLGYRLRLQEVVIPGKAKRGGLLEMTLRIVSEGFAGPKNPRQLEIILREKASRTSHRFDLTSGHDPRFWFPGEHIERLAFRLPRDLAAGNYEVLLNLPDPARRLHERPEYSIRLANQKVWEEKTGYNSLLTTLKVEP